MEPSYSLLLFSILLVVCSFKGCTRQDAVAGDLTNVYLFNNQHPRTSTEPTLVPHFIKSNSPTSLKSDVVHFKPIQKHSSASKACLQRFRSAKTLHIRWAGGASKMRVLSLTLLKRCMLSGTTILRLVDTQLCKTCAVNIEKGLPCLPVLFLLRPPPTLTAAAHRTYHPIIYCSPDLSTIHKCVPSSHRRSLLGAFSMKTASIRRHKRHKRRQKRYSPGV